MATTPEPSTTKPLIEYDEFCFVKGYVCPNCNNKLKKDHIDDIGTIWFKCEKCGQQTSLLKSPFKKEFEALAAEASRVLSSLNPCLEIDTHLANIISGEKDNRLVLFILLLSGKFQEFDMKQMVLIKGTEGSGKSTLMQIADCFKVKDVGRFSEHALDYTNLKDFEVLRLKEIGHMDEEKQGIATLKFLSADDRGYTCEVTIRDKETGQFTTQEIIIPPITVLSGTTRILIEAQYNRRNWIINPDESEDQTKRVCLWRAKLEREKAELALGLRTLTSHDLSKQVLERLVEKLEPCEVIIPFPESLTDILNMKVLRVRGDYTKILTFIKLYAFLNQNRLPKLETEKGKIICVTPDLCIEALKAIEKPLVSMTSNLEERTRKLLEVFKELKLGKDSVITKTVRQDIARRLGKADNTIRLYLTEWEASGFLSGDEKKPRSYTVLYDLKEIEKKVSGISLNSDSADYLINKMKEEAQKWFSSLLNIAYLWVGVDKEVFLTPYKTESLIHTQAIFNPKLSDSKPSLNETTLENPQNTKLTIKLEQVHSCAWLISSIEKGTCGCCQKEGPLTHSILLFPDKREPGKELKKNLCCSECAQIVEGYLRGQEDG